MFQVFIVPNNSTQNVSLTYISEEKAREIHESLTKHIKQGSEIWTAHDDFGYILAIPVATVSYVLFMDIAKSQTLIFERELIAREAQAKLMRDPRSLQLQEPNSKILS